MLITKKLVPNIIQIHKYRHQSTLTFQEVRIPVPWGHIAGKWWGSTNKRPILAMHGLKDNCSSFDPLIPLLPQHLSYLAVDLPGHGYSSRYMPGTYYHGINYILLVRRLQQFFKWRKLSLMGHSLGATIAYTFGCLYDRDVDFVLCFDGLNEQIGEPTLEKIKRNIECFLQFENMPPRKFSHTMEELDGYQYARSGKSLDFQKLRVIVERNVAPSEEPGKFYFTNDKRAKCDNLVFTTMEQLIDLTKRATFPLLITHSSKPAFYDTNKYLKPFIENIRMINNHLEYIEVEGSHHVHFNNPKAISGITSKFIRDHDFEDRNLKAPDEIFVKSN